MEETSINNVGMDEISTYRDLIAQWPSRAELAADLGVSVGRVHKWAQNGSIRAEFFDAIISSAKGRGIEITAEDLCRIAKAEATGASGRSAA